MRLCLNLLAVFIYAAFPVFGMDTLVSKAPFTNGLLFRNGDRVIREEFNLTIPRSTALSGQSRFSNQFFKILKSGDSVIYLLENGSGRLFKTNTSFDSVTRVDKTVHTGYCFGASSFIYNDTIYSIGGYGFWQLTGSVRYFDKTTNEWSIIQSNSNIQFAEGINAITYFDETNSKLYLIYENVSPEYVEKQISKKKVEVIFYDLLKKKWSASFSLENTWAEKMGDLRFIMNGSQGAILNSNKFSKTLLFNFSSNKVFEINDAFLIKKLQLVNRDSDYLLLWRGDTLIINDLKKNLLYSICLQLKEIKNKPIYIKTQDGLNISLHEILDITIPALFIISIILLFKQKRKKGTHEFINNSERVNGSYKITNFVSALNPIELSAFELILKNSLANNRTSVDEVNGVMEISSRPYKIQNNIRAEIIGEINKKFTAFSQISDLLIMRHRADFDKRYFEYFINDRLVAKFKGYF